MEEKNWSHVAVKMIKFYSVRQRIMYLRVEAIIFVLHMQSSTIPRLAGLAECQALNPMKNNDGVPSPGEINIRKKHVDETQHLKPLLAGDVSNLPNP